MGLRFLSDISDKNLDLYYSGLSRNLHNLTFVFRFVTIKVGNSLEAPSLKKKFEEGAAPPFNFVAIAAYKERRTLCSRL